MKRLLPSALPAERALRSSMPSLERHRQGRRTPSICGSALVLGLLSLSACRPSSDTAGASNVNVVNGSAISGRDSGLARSVFHLNVLDETATSVEKSCTAAAIGERIALVAAHCLPLGDNVLPRLKIVGKNATVKQIIGADSLYERALLSEQDAAMDLAALVFESSGPVFQGQEIAKIATTSATPGSSVQMIGFGATDLDALKNPGSAGGSAQAAIGTQQILSADGSTYEFRATHKDLLNPKSGVSIAAPGDSGAPLFNSDGQLIGLLVGLSYYNAGKPLDLTQELTQIVALADTADSYGNKAIDLRSPASQKIIQIALGQAIGPISYQPATDSPTPYLAICRRDRDGGEGGDRSGRDRFGGRDLSDLLDRFGGSGRGDNRGSRRSGSNSNDRNSSSRSGSSSGSSGTSGSSSGNSRLNEEDIRKIFNDL